MDEIREEVKRIAEDSQNDYMFDPEQRVPMT